MNKYHISLVMAVGVWLSSCREVLEPRPIDILADQFVLNQASDVATVRLGAYAAFRGTAAPKVIVGDFTADYIQHNGTFTDYQELGNKQITSANGVAGALWGSVYNTVYVCNFLLEKLPTVPGVREAERKRVTAEARFLRGMANFIGATTFGNIPYVTSTNIDANKTIGKTDKATIMTNVLADFQAALTDLPEGSPTDGRPVFAGYATKSAVRAAMARYYLYQKNWAEAEASASAVISTNFYELVNYSDVVSKDFNNESIFEVGYTASDDPGTSAFGLNNLLVGRREVIPSNQFINQIISKESGERQRTVAFDFNAQGGGDNGWSVRKYGTPDEDNNNIVIFRLGEMYLIRAEARAQQGRMTGSTGALNDLNVLRTRAGKNTTVAANKPPLVTSATQAEALLLIERERLYELAFEGHRWYDLVRTGRAQAVMSAFSPNWTPKYELWPIPQTEIQRNPSLAGQQNPGY
ncbi:RagB/SusD family nutrient uptake outer membrane protein [Runella slithyformis]|nr:RagB/SusD family nutrient uptake outer membrane protein [Runella slithyformis]